MKLICSFLKELQNFKRKYFCVRRKSRQKHNQHFKLLLFTINSHFLISDQIPTYRKLYFLLTGIIYFVFLPLEIQKRHKQIKVGHTYFVWKEKTHGPLKVTAAKTLFSIEYAGPQTLGGRGAPDPYHFLEQKKCFFFVKSE